jgi:hypothetical protein
MPNSLYPANLFATNDADQDRLVSSPLNKYMSHYVNVKSMDVYASLTGESIQKNGTEMIYMLRDMQNLDLIFGEDPTNSFSECYRIAAYISTPEDYTTESSINKWGPVYGHELEVILEPKLFGYQCPVLAVHGPRAGDLLYWPVAETLFEVIWVNNIEKVPFYVHGMITGSPQRRLVLRKFIYSGETVATDNNSVYDSALPPTFPGIDAINDMEDDHLLPHEHEQIQEQGDEITAIIDEINPFGIVI